MPSSTPAEPVVEEDRVCPECGSEHLVRDYARGELVCDSCGLVISEGAIDEGPEWSAYSVEENDRLARTGAPRSYVAGASGLTTVIPLANRDARGNTIPLREREKFYRMRKLQRHSGHSRPGERSLPETIRSLDRVASLMGLPRPVKDEAGFICKKALEKGLVRGRRIEAVVVAPVYAACRIAGVPLAVGDRRGGDISGLLGLRGASSAEGDGENRRRQRGDLAKPLPIHGRVHGTADPATRSRAEGWHGEPTLSLVRPRPIRVRQNREERFDKVRLRPIRVAESRGGIQGELLNPQEGPRLRASA